MGRISHRRGRPFVTSAQQDSSVNRLIKARSLEGAVYFDKKGFCVTKGLVFLLVEQKEILNAIGSFLLLSFYYVSITWIGLGRQVHQFLPRMEVEKRFKE